MKLYSYFRSSAAYRVRIALALKGLDYEYVSVQIAKGKQFEPAFAALNAQNLVPVLEDESKLLYQSLAIIQYLDETYPEPRILPTDRFERNRVRSLALIIACEIHPLNNLRVLKYLTDVLKVTDEQKIAWYHHWVTTGFTALEHRLATGAADRALLPRRHAGLRRHLAGAAGGQRAALQGGPDAVPDHRADRCGVQRDSRRSARRRRRCSRTRSDRSGSPLPEPGRNSAVLYNPVSPPMVEARHPTRAEPSRLPPRGLPHVDFTPCRDRAPGGFRNDARRRRAGRGRCRPPTNKLERFQLKHANCKWTNEMGNYMYECLKANFNMNAHWCHNEAMDVFCPKQDETAQAAEPKPAEAAKPAN